MGEKRSPAAERTLKDIQTVLESGDRDLRSSLCKDILLNALKCERDSLDILDLKVIRRALSEFRYAARVFKPYRDTRKISIFGSARTSAESLHYQMAVELGRLMAERGFMVITGAAEGIMRAGIQGAGPERSFGVNIFLPFEIKPASLMQEDPKLITFRYFFTRKLFFVMEAHAFALFPGGFGTHDEAFEVLTLMQTGRSVPMPLVLVQRPGDGYWTGWDSFVREHLRGGSYICDEDLSFYHIVESPEAAAEWISFYYSTYHSMRQVGDILVIRLEKQLSDAGIEQINRSFSDLLISGSIARSEALPTESDEPKLLSKPRLAFAYNRRSAGRLNQMVLAINEMGRSGPA